MISTTDKTAAPYRTTELEIASFLKACGHRLIAARMDGRFVSFEFDPAAANDVASYFTGAEISARDLFEAHRFLRALIQQVREHSSQKIGTEHKSNEYQSRQRPRN